MIMQPRQFPCSQCGADLKFAPGTHALVCPYCGTENTITPTGEPISELDFKAAIQALRTEGDTYEVLTVHCKNCGAQTTLDPHVTSDVCPFCASSLVHETASTRQIKPQALLPFKIDDREAHRAFDGWLKGLWFAPNDLKTVARQEGRLAGMYLPHWTYDTDTTTRYTGRRGEYYYVTESYTTVENGKTVQRTRQVQKTRWYPASGVVFNNFDDVLVAATTSLPHAYLTRLEPWDLEAVVPYTDAYLSGFRTESYSIALEQGFDLATQRMEPIIVQTIHQDIGGDTQQILTKNTSYANITFKHLLLPVWISTYRYHDKVYRFLVNARTGEVIGDRPWSWIKITLAVLLALVVAAGLYYFTQYR